MSTFVKIQIGLSENGKEICITIFKWKKMRIKAILAQYWLVLASFGPGITLKA